ncbi:neprilysin-1-like [Ornithodoros turicata]|uniref:neprilysin-1-like n=1 Tax=Ornithodoros turicata TaxID=34597 RepID=UPI003139F614
MAVEEKASAVGCWPAMVAMLSMLLFNGSISDRLLLSDRDSSSGMGELRLRNVLSVILVYFSLSSLGTTRGLPTEVVSVREVCNTTQCEERAKFLQGILNTSADPCDDFDQYVCRKWLDAHPIPADQSSYGVFTQLKADLETELKDVLGNATLSFHPPDSPNITHKILRAYQSCMNENTSEENSTEALRGILRDVGIAKWPVSYTDADIPEWNETFTKLVLKLGLTPVVTLYVLEDLRNVTNYVLQMDQHIFGTVGRNQFLNQSNQHNRKIIEAYKAYIVNVTKLMTNGSTGHKDPSALADEIVDFEVQIANFPFMEIVKNIFNNISIRVDEKEPVIVWDTEYYKSVFDFLGTVNRLVRIPVPATESRWQHGRRHEGKRFLSQDNVVPGAVGAHHYKQIMYRENDPLNILSCRTPTPPPPPPLEKILAAPMVGNHAE